MANVSRASNRKDSTPRWCGRPTALRDFEPRDGSYGSSSAHAVKATRPCLSVLPPKSTFTNQDVIRRFVQEPIHAPQQTAPSFNHVVGNQQKLAANRQPQISRRLRLITSSNLIGCSTGNSAGLLGHR